MSLFNTLEIASSGMKAQRTRMNVAAMNMANKETTRTAEGGPYRRRDVILEAVPMESTLFDEQLGNMLRAPSEQIQGVRVASIERSQEEPSLIFDPGHPDANADGYVAMPNLNAMKEMVNLMSAARAYEAGTTVMKSVKQIAQQALKIGK